MGGFAGFGGPAAKIRSRGQVDLDRLSPNDRAVVDTLFRDFRTAPRPEPLPDAFRYRLRRGSGANVETIEVSEGVLPRVVTDALTDALR